VGHVRPPDHIRRSIGTKLLQEVAHSVDDASRKEVSVVAQSGGAMKFYKKHGFQTYKAETCEVFPNLKIPVEVMQCDTSEIIATTSFGNLQ